MKLYLILAAAALATVHSSYTPEQVMVDVTNEFGTCILKVVGSGWENVAFSPYGLVSVALVLYEGANGPTAAEIHNSLRLPWDTQVTRIGFRDLHRYLKSYFTNDGFLRGLVLSKPNVVLHRNYTDQLQFYGFDFRSEGTTPAPVPMTTSREATMVPVSTVTPGTTTTKPSSRPTTAIPTTTMTTVGMEGKGGEGEVPTTTPPRPAGGGEEGVTTVDVSVVKTTVSMTVTAAVNPTTSPPETTTTPPPAETTTTPPPAETTTTPPPKVTTTSAPPPPAETTTAPVTEPPATTTQAPTTTTQAPTTLTQVTTTTAPETTVGTTLPTTTEAVATPAPPADSEAGESRLVTRKERALYAKGYVPQDREGIPNWVPHYQDPRWGQQQSPQENWFFAPSGGERVPIITYTAYLPFAHVSEISALALQLPLDDPRYYMVILLPEERDGLEKLLYSLQWCSIRGVVNQLKTTAIYATIPTFTIVKHINLVPALAKMGILRVFDPAKADLSAMATEPGLYVRTIEQVVTVSLRKYFANHRWFDATPGDVEQHFIANHPFAYFVLDKETQVTLMSGTIVNPIAHNQ